MKAIQAAKFKASCLEVLRTVERTGEAVIVTLRHRPVVRIEPIRERREVKLGTLQGQMEIEGDIVHADFDEDWE